MKIQPMLNKSLLSALVIASMASNVVCAANSSVQVELRELENRKFVSSKRVKYEYTGETFADFEILPEPRLIGGPAIQKYMKDMKRVEDDFARVGGPGTKAPYAKGYYWQKAGRAVKKTLALAWNILEPYAIPLGIRVTGDIALGAIGPYLMEKTAQTAANVASALSSWWTSYIPFADQAVRITASTAARGEFMRDTGTLMSYVERLSGPAYRAAKNVTGHAVSAVKKVGSAISSAWSWFRGSTAKKAEVPA